MNGQQRVYVGPAPGPDDYADVPGGLNAAGGSFFVDADVADLPAAYTYRMLVSCATLVSVSERNVALLEQKK